MRYKPSLASVPLNTNEKASRRWLDAHEKLPQIISLRLCVYVYQLWKCGSTAFVTVSAIVLWWSTSLWYSLWFGPLGLKAALLRVKKNWVRLFPAEKRTESVHWLYVIILTNWMKDILGKESIGGFTSFVFTCYYCTWNPKIRLIYSVVRGFCSIIHY